MDAAAARRRPRDETPRPRTFHVRVSDAEHAALNVRAAAQGITVSALLVESALAKSRSQGPGRAAVLAELMAVRRELVLARQTGDAISDVVFARLDSAVCGLETPVGTVTDEVPEGSTVTDEDWS